MAKYLNIGIGFDYRNSTTIGSCIWPLLIKIL